MRLAPPVLTPARPGRVRLAPLVGTRGPPDGILRVRLVPPVVMPAPPDRLVSDRRRRVHLVLPGNPWAPPDGIFRVRPAPPGFAPAPPELLVDTRLVIVKSKLRFDVPLLVSSRLHRRRLGNSGNTTFNLGKKRKRKLRCNRKLWD